MFLNYLKILLHYFLYTLYNSFSCSLSHLLSYNYSRLNHIPYGTHGAHFYRSDALHTAKLTVSETKLKPAREIHLLALIK